MVPFALILVVWLSTELHAQGVGVPTEESFSTVISTKKVTGSTTYHVMQLTAGIAIEYAIVLPPAFDPQRIYPVLVALPPGQQTIDLVTDSLNEYWVEGAMQHGWVVISPAAPGNRFYFKEGEKFISEFLDSVAVRFHPEGGKLHLAGVSNGGLSAFHIAVRHPDKFRSVLTAPGSAGDDLKKLKRLKSIPVAMFVGEKDGWRPEVELTQVELSRLGGQVQVTILPNEGHILSSLYGGKRMFEFLELAR